MKKKFWKIAWWMLLICWVTGALLFMARIKGGFFTNYLSDLTFPAWFYIFIRGHATTDNKAPQLLIFRDWFGVSPKRAVISILLVGIATEIKTFYWPRGIITGTLDYFDIVAYALGLLIFYYLDLRGTKRQRTTM